MSLLLSNFPELAKRDMSKWAFESYVQQPVVYPQFCHVGTPAEFGASPADLYFRMATGGSIGTLQPRDPGQPLDFSPTFEDYPRQCKRRQIYDAQKIPKEFLAVTQERALVNWLQNTAQQWGREHARHMDWLAARWVANGSTAAGNRSIFDQSVINVSDDPGGGLLIYDGDAWFDDDHPQSKANTSTTYDNLIASTSFSYANLQTVITAMTMTNAYDTRGKQIVIRPNVLMVGPSLEFEAKKVLLTVNEPGTGNNTANVISDLNLQLVVNRYIAGSNEASVSVASGWYLFEAGLSADLVVIPEWRAPEVEVWYDEADKSWKTSFEAFYGIFVRDWRHSICANVAAA